MKNSSFLLCSVSCSSLTLELFPFTVTVYGICQSVYYNSTVRLLCSSGLKHLKVPKCFSSTSGLVETVNSMKPKLKRSHLTLQSKVTTLQEVIKSLIDYNVTFKGNKP